MRKTLITIAAAVLPAGAWAMSENAMNEEIMAQCAMLSDATGLQWDQVARMRGLTVKLDDCVKASAALAKELEPAAAPIRREKPAIAPRATRAAEWAGKHRPITDAERENCLLTDNRGVNHDGDEFCVQSSVGLSQAQIDAFFKREGEISAAPFIAEMKPGYKNCWREIDDAKRLGSWTGPPSAEDCIQWAEKLQTKGRAMIDKGLKELMESK
jgi:hypothetical protein